GSCEARSVPADRLRRWAAIAVAGLTAASCTSHRTAARPSPPSTATTLTAKTPRLSPVGLPQCRPADLTATVGTPNGLTGGTVVMDIVLHNVGTTAGAFAGTPTVDPLDARGAVVPHHFVLLDGDFARAAATALAPEREPG